MNIHQFFQASVSALQWYILLHYDRQTWFKSWVGLSDVEKYFKSCGGSLGSGFFHFDWASAGYRRMAESWTVYRCRTCGVVSAESFCCDTPSIPLAFDEAFEFFRDHQYRIYEQELLDALLIDGWRIFCAELHPLTNPHRREALECLAAIAADRDPMDQLVHLMWSLKIPHHSGDIIDTYSAVDMEMVKRVRSEGIKDVFGEADVNRFLAGEYPPIHIDLEKLRKDCPPYGEDEWEIRYGAQTSKNQPASSQIGKGA